MLYRGVSVYDDLLNDGLLKPKGKTLYVEPTIDTTKITADSTHFTLGLSYENSARAHQIEGGLFDAAGISTTRCLEQAIKFATSSNMEDGYVYVLDENKLAELGVVMKEFLDPEHRLEREVTLLISDMQPVPAEAIIDKIKVTADGVSVRPIPAN